MGSASSESISTDTMVAVYAALSTSQTADGLEHNGLLLEATKTSLADLDTFQYDRVDAALVADVAGQGADKSLYDDSDETWFTSNDRLDRNPPSPVRIRAAPFQAGSFLYRLFCVFSRGVSEAFLAAGFPVDKNSPPLSPSPQLARVCHVLLRTATIAVHVVVHLMRFPFWRPSIIVSYLF